MSLIYSRPRFKMPRIFGFNNRNQQNPKRKIFIIVILLMICIIINTIRAVTPTYNQLCAEKATETATLIITEETKDIISKYNYMDFINVHKDTDGNVLMLESNMININKLSLEVSNRIQNRLSNVENGNIGISLGSFTGIAILSGIGAQVPIKISTIGNIKTEIKSEFISTGINQTLHRLYLEIKCEVSILTPFNTIKQEVNKELIIGENIIVGEIPETYYHLDGITEDDSLNFID